MTAIFSSIISAPTDIFKTNTISNLIETLSKHIERLVLMVVGKANFISNFYELYLIGITINPARNSLGNI